VIKFFPGIGDSKRVSKEDSVKLRIDAPTVQIADKLSKECRAVWRPPLRVAIDLS
jgi:hypothetical protein